MKKITVILLCLALLALGGGGVYLAIEKPWDKDEVVEDGVRTPTELTSEEQEVKELLLQAGLSFNDIKPNGYIRSFITERKGKYTTISIQTAENASSYATIDGINKFKEQLLEKTKTLSIHKSLFTKDFGVFVPEVFEEENALNLYGESWWYQTEDSFIWINFVASTGSNVPYSVGLRIEDSRYFQPNFKLP